MQPGGEGAFETERIQLLPRADERFLGQFLGARRVHSRQPPDRAMHASDMPPIEFFERRDLAGAGATDQFTIFRFGPWCVDHRQWHGKADGAHSASLDAWTPRRV